MRNFVRYYEFTFFDVNADNSIKDIPNVKISSSLNFSFEYNIITGIFNTAKFYIYNMSENTLNLFTSKKNKRGFYFRATYDNPLNLAQSLIFRGLTYRVNSYREGTDLITEVTACDPYFNLQQPTMKYEAPPGTTAISILQAVSNYLGVFNAVSGESYLVGQTVYNHPISFSNTSVADIINTVTNDNICTWASDISGIRIIPRPNNPNYDDPVIRITPLISRNTGLVGNVRAESLSVQLFPVDYYSQQRLQNNHPFITATILMRPIALSSKIKLECEFPALNGLYRVFAASYSGEYRGNNWYVTLKLSPIASQ